MAEKRSNPEVVQYSLCGLPHGNLPVVFGEALRALLFMNMVFEK
jgi:hypothetical protein